MASVSATGHKVQFLPQYCSTYRNVLSDMISRKFACAVSLEIVMKGLSLDTLEVTLTEDLSHLRPTSKMEI